MHHNDLVLRAQKLPPSGLAKLLAEVGFATIRVSVPSESAHPCPAPDPGQFFVRLRNRAPDHAGLADDRIFEGDPFRIVVVEPSVGVVLIGKDLEVILVAYLL